MTSTTSIKAFEGIRKQLGLKQYVVLTFLSHLGEASNKTLARRSGIPINEITPRIKELRDYGIVYQVAERPDIETNKTSAIWAVRQPEDAIRCFNKFHAEKKPIQVKTEFQKEFL